jgi:hypothetical protein
VTLDGIKIDEELAPLIAKLWDAGVKTTSCCQEREPGVAWIQFPSPAEAMKFFVTASTLVGSCGWIVYDGHVVGDDFEANPLGCVSIEFAREGLSALGAGRGQRPTRLIHSGDRPTARMRTSIQRNSDSG